MIVAVDAGDHRRTLHPRQELKAAAGNLFKLENIAGLLPSLVWHSILQATEQVEVGGKKLNSRVHENLTIRLGEWLRREIWIFRSGRQRQVKLRGSSAQ